MLQFKKIRMAGESPREILIRRLKELQREVGRSPTVDDLSEADGFPTLSEYLQEFGWWNEAKKAAGLSTNQGGESTGSRPGPEPAYGREKLLDKLRELEDAIEGQATKRDMREADEFPSPATYRRRFGSWKTARRKAGLEPITKKEYSDEELIRSLQKKAEEVEGRPLRRKDIAADEDLPHPSIYNERFNSFREAKQIAGVR